MMREITMTNYWFTIEPYVYVGLTNKNALLYNTLDGAIIESDKFEIIELLQETLQKENHGVILLSDEQFSNRNIAAFIRELREKYMGDIIDVSLSKGKPVQLLPFFDFSDSDESEIYKRHNFSLDRNVLEKLFEISIHVDSTTNVTKLVTFLQSVPKKLSINIVGNIKEVAGYEDLLSFLNKYSFPKNFICSYINVIPLQPAFEHNFSYSIVIDFPIDIRHWNNAQGILLNQTLPYEFVFNVSSLSECQQAEQIIEQFHIKKFQLKPIYTGSNIHFFKENIFLSKEDILSSPISLKNIFANQSINTYDFGKINIMPNGDAFANVNHPCLGNIYTDSLYDLIWKEINSGKSWRRIRNQVPCNGCVYQWLCPSPSDYELLIGCPNLCHIEQPSI